jgi:hypothetical protein
MSSSSTHGDPFHKNAANVERQTPQALKINTDVPKSLGASSHADPEDHEAGMSSNHKEPIIYQSPAQMEPGDGNAHDRKEILEMAEDVVWEADLINIFNRELTATIEVVGEGRITIRGTVEQLISTLGNDEDKLIGLIDYVHKNYCERLSILEKFKQKALASKSSKEKAGTHIK